jgi:hypothetical protein
MAKPKLQVLTANRLSDGTVVYLDAHEHWVEDLAAAEVARTETDAGRLVRLGDAAVRDRLVVGPYLFAVDPKADRIRPVSQREHIRALGPTAGTDLLDTHLGA